MEKVHTTSTASDGAMKRLFNEFERAKDTLTKDFNRAKDDFDKAKDVLGKATWMDVPWMVTPWMEPTWMAGPWMATIHPWRGHP